MKVRATDVGYFGLQLKKVGDVFDVSKEQFSGLWMQALDKKDQKDFPAQDKQAFKDQIDAVASGQESNPEKDEKPESEEHEEPVI